MWDAAAIGNAEWSGVKLVDVLKVKRRRRRRRRRRGGG